MKVNSNKSYHPYLSNDKKHDQNFVKVAIEEILSEAVIPPCVYIVIESNNCSCQYKSRAHFDSIQELSNHYSANIICVFGIAEHRKGEVDHVGGLAKTAVRREIVASEFFHDSSEMVIFLKEKFEKNSSTKYFVKEI